MLGVAVLLHWRKMDAQCMAGAWLAAALVSCALALLQYFGLATELAPWVSRSELGQSYANLRQRNQFASLTSIGLVCLLALQAGSERRDSGASARPDVASSGWLKRAGTSGWAGAAAALLALGNAASSSRTGFLQWTLILALLLGARLLHGRQSSQAKQDKPQSTLQGTQPSTEPGQRLTTALALSLCAMASYAVFLWVLPSALLAWQQIEIGSLAERLADSGQDSRFLLWSNVLHLIAQKPWSGWGWGELDYAHFITAYPGARFPVLLDNAHNLPLQLAVELGLPFSLLVGLALAALAWRIKPWQERQPGRLLAWGVLAVIGVHSMLEYPLWYGPFQWAAGFCALWLWRTRANARADLSNTRAESARAARSGIPAFHVIQPLLLAGLCWAALACIALDYARVSQLYMPAKERWDVFQMQPLVSMDKLGGSVFFKDEVRFAGLVTTAVTAQNAAQMHALAQDMLHYSPEPRVVEPLIASAIFLGRDDTARFYLSRYRAAFSDEDWVQLLARRPGWAERLPQ